MNILVLGGTGFMGPHVIRSLVAEGHLVTVFTRGNLRPELPTDVQCVTGDYKKLPVRATHVGIRPEDVSCFVKLVSGAAIGFLLKPFTAAVLKSKVGDLIGGNLDSQEIRTVMEQAAHHRQTPESWRFRFPPSQAQRSPRS